MDSRTYDAGAVAGGGWIRNPILAVRAMLENRLHLLFTGEGVKNLVAAHSLEMVGVDFFFIQPRFEQLYRAQQGWGGCCSNMTARWRLALRWIPIGSSAPLAQWR